MEGVAAPTSVGVACAEHMDSLSREAQGGASQYVSRHRMSLVGWSAPTLLPSPEAEFTLSASVLSPHNSLEPNAEMLLGYVAMLSASAQLCRYAA